MYQKRKEMSKSSFISTIFHTKKAQVTIFIILGIVILIAVSLVILLKTELVTFKTGDIIPTEKGKVENYITSCIEKIGEEALPKMSDGLRTMVGESYQLYAETSDVIHGFSGGPNFNLRNCNCQIIG